MVEPWSYRVPRGRDRLIAGRIKERRLELRVKQEVLAADVGVTQKEISAYETCRQRVPKGRLGRIAEALAVPLDHLIPAASRR